MKRLIRAAIVCVLAAACASPEHDAESDGDARIAGDGDWKSDFAEDARDLVTTGRNPYFVLEPGYTLVLEGTDDDQPSRLVIRVLDDTLDVGGIRARVVEERETHGAELVEVSRNYFVLSRATNSVYYLGEDVETYRHGKVAGREGSWRHGKDGARLGMMMPGTFRVGDRFHEEFAPRVAMDRAEILSASESITTPAGAFDHCLRVEETSPLELGSKEYKLYAPGVGLIRDGELELVRYGKE